MSQNARLLRVKASFIDDSCVVTYLNGSESLSQPFQLQLGFQSIRESFSSEDVIGQKVAVAIHPQGRSDPHYLHGRVNQLTLQDVSDNGTRGYELSLVPGLWFLSQAGCNRIFENKTAVEIVKEVIKSYGAFCPLELKVSKRYLVREYCVQFNESDLAFVQRLLAEDGINYYFTHSETEHTLVLADAPGGFADTPEGTVVIENRARTGGSEGVAIFEWRRTLRYHPQACEQLDYNQDTPKNFYKQNIPTTSKFSQVPAVNSLQRYGGYNFKDGSNSCHDFEPDYNKLLTAHWMEAMESTHNVAEATSNCTGFRAGARFELDHALASECDKYLLTRVSHQASNSTGGLERYQNRFQCVAAKVPVRPPREQVKRHMPGPQMAKVMSMSASASQGDADPQRMIRVQFPWDSEHNSCKLRVLQGYAGSGWGASFVPREGQEVLVDFINGDPDRPIVVGAMYNKDNQGPKYTATQSGWLTQSGNANEFRFDDKNGAEEVYMKAGKDYNFVVANNETGAVHNDQSLAVSNMRSVDVGADETKTVGANQSLTVGTNQTLTVGANQSNTIASNKTETIAVNFAETVGAAKELTIGGLYQVTVGAAMNETVAAVKAEEVGASRFLVVGQSMSEDVGKDRSLNVGNTSTHTAKKIQISAEDELVITVGKASITMKKDGTITVSGKDIDFKGSGKINVKASKDVIIKGKKVLTN
ncbi:type VI secretion system Vgr family protein [Ketobacter sp.]|uniref:type VI secretion system Vgr family protein n=1 Tax=Ketobacter sp. TaxID=2083498 RepID=UPI000F2DC787|nr:type VI secretion system tip protein TssI/VgrG [Ketobacter sp.]RLU00320.1 MAG: type VI secretion system tip protein VgrG [Ketobacter sp.]